MSQLVAINAAASINSEDDLRDLEHARLRALVEGNIALARQLHADDFHLVTPIGRSYSKDRYLSEIENGALRYHSWVPGAMQVRSFGSTAVLRYQATLELDSGGGRTPPFRCWHIDSYELINGLWQVVWSQATSIRP
ncbi:MAG TPA: nuclear transport factor 2 family protein [Methylibium sp.]